MDKKFILRTFKTEKCSPEEAKLLKSQKGKRLNYHSTCTFKFSCEIFYHTVSITVLNFDNLQYMYTIGTSIEFIADVC